MTPLQNQPSTENAMAVSLSIKGVSEDTLLRLRARAERNHRSLQKELLAIVEAATQEAPPLTVDQLAEYVQGMGLATPDEATGWIRAHRDAH
jgi:plasmid stability protein